MKKHGLFFLLVSVSSFFISNAASAAAFQLYELGTPVIGSAGVGQAALASDASTVYFNPAGMTSLQNSQFMVGSQLIVPFANFSPSSSVTISGNNGGNAGTLMPGLGLYYVYNYSPQLKFGASFTSPYGGMLTYNDGWVGRFVVQNMEFYTLNLNPALSYRFNNWLSVGMGVAAEYANLHETVALPLTPLVDGQMDIKVNNTAAGFNFGVLFTPSQQTKIGIAYRSQVTHHFRGNTTFLRISDTPSTTTKMVMPQNVIFSLKQNVENKFVFLGELGWANWASMRNTIVTIDRYTAITPRNWNNTYRVGVGGQYRSSPAVLLQAGASYDSSPTTSSRRLPDLPMDRQVRVGLGLLYSFTRAAQLGFSYEYINFGKASITNASSNGVLAGSYSRNYANVLQASINVGAG